MVTQQTNFGDVDHAMMTIALQQALLAAERQEVPVGACLHFPDQDIHFSAGNQTLADNDVTSHAEILCLKKAFKHFDNHRLPQSTLYVSLEPCVMCIGALVQARVTKIHIAARDTRTQSIHSHVNLYDGTHFNHRFQVSFGLYKDKSEQILANFFHARRT